MNNKKKKLILLSLSVALSLTSVWAGFHYYLSLFGAMVAVTASFAFETIRLTALYAIFFFNSSRKFISILLYLFSAFVCFFAALNHLHSEVIQNHAKAIQGMVKRQKTEITNIKNIQAQERQQALKKTETDLTWAETRLAKYPESRYWKNRLNQIETRQKETIAYYDSVLSYIPKENIESWIARESAKLNLERENPNDQLGKSWAIAQAITDIWNLSESQAKKYSAIVLVLGVELGIFMLAFISNTFDENYSFSKKRKLKPLIRKFGLDEIENYIAFCREHHSKKNRLPSPRELSKKNREIRCEVLKDEGLQEMMLATIMNNHRP